MMQLIADNKILAYCIPQGQFAQLYRSMAGGEPGKITKVGLGTFIDPRIDGGKMNEITMSASDINEVVYHRRRGNICAINPSLWITASSGEPYVDEYGNLTTGRGGHAAGSVPSRRHGMQKFGGKVLAQAKYKVRAGSLHCKRVIVPGGYSLMRLSSVPNPEEDHRQTHSFYMDPAYCGDTKAPVSSDDVLPISLRKVIGRRALMELAPG